MTPFEEIRYTSSIFDTDGCRNEKRIRIRQALFLDLSRYFRVSRYERAPCKQIGRFRSLGLDDLTTGIR
jgi:hypothetical protein